MTNSELMELAKQARDLIVGKLDPDGANVVVVLSGNATVFIASNMREHGHTLETIELAGDFLDRAEEYMLPDDDGPLLMMG